MTFPSLIIVLGVVVLLLVMLQPFLLLETESYVKVSNKAPRDASWSADLRARDDILIKSTVTDINPDITCVTKECIDSIATTIARVYPQRHKRVHDKPESNSTRHEWCIPENDNSKDSQGFILIKVPKGASSTSAGVAIRIARRNRCKVSWIHRRAVDYQQYSPEQTFFFTTIRDPADRAISTIFFHVVSRTPNLTVTDDFIMKYLQYSNDQHWGSVSDGQGGFQLRYTAFSNIPPQSAWTSKSPNLVLDPQRVIDNIRDTLNAYGFMLVTDRMDESLVAMALILDIDVGDVVVTSSKVAGSRYHLVAKPHSVHECLPTVKAYTTPAIDTFLQSSQWRAMNYGDYLLYAAANKSLDMTIDALGHDKFDAAYSKYKRLKSEENQVCAPHVKFPCSNEGVAQIKASKESCYLAFYDFGCGYKCIDRIIESDKE